jgi:hypothetical protein
MMMMMMMMLMMVEAEEGRCRQVRKRMDCEASYMGLSSWKNSHTSNYTSSSSLPPSHSQRGSKPKQTEEGEVETGE